MECDLKNYEVEELMTAIRERYDNRLETATNGLRHLFILLQDMDGGTIHLNIPRI
jgi:hypothetical protein